MSQSKMFPSNMSRQQRQTSGTSLTEDDLPPPIKVPVFDPVHDKQIQATHPKLVEQERKNQHKRRLVNTLENKGKFKLYR